MYIMYIYLDTDNSHKARSTWRIPHGFGDAPLGRVRYVDQQCAYAHSTAASRVADCDIDNTNMIDSNNNKKPGAEICKIRENNNK